MLPLPLFGKSRRLSLSPLGFDLCRNPTFTFQILEREMLNQGGQFLLPVSLMPLPSISSPFPRSRASSPRCLIVYELIKASNPIYTSAVPYPVGVVYRMTLLFLAGKTSFLCFFPADLIYRLGAKKGRIGGIDRIKGEGTVARDRNLWIRSGRDGNRWR